MRTVKINKHTILVDYRGNRKSPETLAGLVRSAANEQFWGSADGMIRDVDQRTGDSGCLLGNNLTNVYHVQSVAAKVFIASTREMSPDQTRPIVQKYIEGTGKVAKKGK